MGVCGCVCVFICLFIFNLAEHCSVNTWVWGVKNGIGWVGYDTRNKQSADYVFQVIDSSILPKTTFIFNVELVIFGTFKMG